MRFDDNLNLEATELRLGLPGTTTTTTTTNPQDNEDPEKQTYSKSNKRSLLDMNEESTESREHSNVLNHKKGRQETAPPSKTQVVGWPPIRSYRKNCLQERKIEAEAARMYVKVSMDGAPFLRKIDLKVYKGYSDLLTALEDMFKFKIGKYFGGEGYNGPDYAPTYEDKEGDWMLVGDVPWDMFIISCKRLRIMKGSEARGLGCVV